MARISIPTTARLPSSMRIDPTNPTLVKILNRLSRPSLLSLALDWLREDDLSLSAPYLQPLLEDEDDEDDDADDFYPPAHSVEELQEQYTDLQSQKGSKREIVDRILEGDWRDGLTMYQLAMADLQYLYDHPTSQKWSAYRMVPLKAPSPSDDTAPDRPDKESLAIPRFHPATFLQKLQAQIPPDVKAHYTFERHKDLPLLLLRIFILDSPYNTALALSSAAATFDGTRTIYAAFPDASPHIYLSRPQSAGTGGPQTAGDARSLLSLVTTAIPSALSRPRERYTLKSTNLVTRNLGEMLGRRGAGRTNAAGGGWGVYADDDKRRESPLDVKLPTPPGSEGEGEKGKRKRLLSVEEEREVRSAKRRRRVAQARFGDSARVGDGLGVERVDIQIRDPFPGFRGDDAEEGEDDGQGEGSDARAQPLRGRRSGGGQTSTTDSAFQREAETRAASEESGQPDGEEEERRGWCPEVRLTFHGSHVFAGLRQLVEAGIIDGEKMPGWMTGEEGVTIGAVRNGRIRGHRGSGI